MVSKTKDVGSIPTTPAMNSNFDKEEISRWFGEDYTCWWCGEYHANTLHHILGRSGKYKFSLLNAAPLDNENCHLKIHSSLNKKENKKMLLQKTLTYLLSQGYKLNDTDKEFLYENKEFYKKDS